MVAALFLMSLLSHIGCDKSEDLAKIYLEEKLHYFRSQSQGDGLQEIDVVSQHLIFLKVKRQGDDVVDVVIAEYIVQGRLLLDVVNQHIQCLQHL